MNGGRSPADYAIWTICGRTADYQPGYSLYLLSEGLALPKTLRDFKLWEVCFIENLECARYAPSAFSCFSHSAFIFLARASRFLSGFALSSFKATSMLSRTTSSEARR